MCVLKMGICGLFEQLAYGHMESAWITGYKCVYEVSVQIPSQLVLDG